jgi:hypothetical protein
MFFSFLKHMWKAKTGYLRKFQSVDCPKGPDGRKVDLVERISTVKTRAEHDDKSAGEAVFDFVFYEIRSASVLKGKGAVFCPFPD